MEVFLGSLRSHSCNYESSTPADCPGIQRGCVVSARRYLFSSLPTAFVTLMYISIFAFFQTRPHFPSIIVRCFFARPSYIPIRRFCFVLFMIVNVTLLRQLHVMHITYSLLHVVCRTLPFLYGCIRKIVN